MLVVAFGLSEFWEGEFGPTRVQGTHAPLFAPPRAETVLCLSFPSPC